MTADSSATDPDPDPEPRRPLLEKPPVEVSVVVPVHNAMAHLPTVLPSFRRAVRRHGSAELILVDNGSEDGSLSYLRARGGPDARVDLLEHGNVGAVRNRGARMARGRHLSFLDADCLVPEDYLERALEVLARTGGAATGNRYELPPDPSWVERIWTDLHRRPVDGPVSYLPAGNFFIRRDAFEAVGGFDETLVSGEDAEICQRLRRAGYEIHASRAVRVQHLGNPKSVGQFLRKQIWHAMGALGTVDARSLDRPTAMLALHLLLVVGGVATALVAPLSPGGRMALLAVAFLGVPVVTVLYRAREAGTLPAPARSVFLYFLYYLARAVGLVKNALRGAR